MPPPVVYVAAVAGVVVTVAAVFAFKEFVYTPHIAPKVDAWRQVAAEHRRQRRARNRGPIAVPVASESALNQRSSRDSEPKGAAGRASPLGSVELQDLGAEATEWRRLGTDNNLRRRRGGASNVLDESNVFVPYDPISPTPLSNVSIASSPAPSESIVLPSSPIIHSPLPTTAINASRLQQSASTRSPESSPRDTNPKSRTTPIAPRSPSPANTDLASSMSTTSSFTPAVIGPASSPSVTLDATSPPVSHPGSPATSPFIDAAWSPPLPGSRSATMSPFSDIHAIDAQSPPSHPLAPNYARSPSPVLLSPPQSSLHLASESDFAILSPDLRSGMFSPGMSSVDEDAFDFDDFASSDSDGGSSGGGWASVGRRTPSPTHYGNHFE